VLLGKHGTSEAVQNYARVIGEWEARGRALPTAPAKSDLSITELIARFWRYATEYYRHPDGRPTSEQKDYRFTLRPLEALYGDTSAAEFGPLALEAVRRKMLADGLCRNVINQRISRIKRMFGWAVSQELLAATNLHALQSLAGLREGRTPARETEPVKPVPDAFVDAVLPHVLPPVRAMIELQRRTGMRPGEVTAMRPCDIETGGKFWYYRPPHHKTRHRGKDRVVPLAERAKVLVKQFLTFDTQAFLFSPARALAERTAILRANRKTPVQPSQRNRRAKNRRRAPADRYTSHSYLVAIRRGCDKADRLARQEAENAKAAAEGREPIKAPATVDAADRKVPYWHPNQLRHNFATLVRRTFGLEAAQVSLGHSRADVTQHYAERDLGKAEEVAAAIG
jgi:integrase